MWMLVWFIVRLATVHGFDIKCLHLSSEIWHLVLILHPIQWSILLKWFAMARALKHEVSDPKLIQIGGTLLEQEQDKRQDLPWLASDMRKQELLFSVLFHHEKIICATWFACCSLKIEFRLGLSVMLQARVTFL